MQDLYILNWSLWIRKQGIVAAAATGTGNCSTHFPTLLFYHKILFKILFGIVPNIHNFVAAARLCIVH